MKGVVFSYFFPPLNSSEGNVTFKLINASKFDYDVYFQNLSEKWSYGKNNSLRGDNIHLISSNSKDVKAYKENGIKYFTPDVMDKYDFMMSRSMPPESHEIALAVKKRMPNKYWLASFGDPIARNPYELHARAIAVRSSVRTVHGMKACVKYYLKKFWYRHDNKKKEDLQRTIFANADTLIFNSELQSRYMLAEEYEKYKKKVLIIPHSYDTSLYMSRYEEIVLGHSEEKLDNNKVNVLFAGHSDSLRSLSAFLWALNAGKSYFEDKLQFTILGNLPVVDRDYIKHKGLGSFVNYGKQVHYKKSLSCMKNSDLLIHVDAVFPGKVMKENIFFAAKIADYLGSGTKILGLTTEGVSQDILLATGNYCIPNNTVLISNFLYDVVQGKISVEKAEALPPEYDVNNVVKAYDDRIEEYFDVE